MDNLFWFLWAAMISQEQEVTWGDIAVTVAVFAVVFVCLALYIWFMEWRER